MKLISEVTYSFTIFHVTLVYHRMSFGLAHRFDVASSLYFVPARKSSEVQHFTALCDS